MTRRTFILFLLVGFCGYGLFRAGNFLLTTHQGEVIGRKIAGLGFSERGGTESQADEDQARQWIQEAVDAYDQIRSYEALFHREELKEGKFEIERMFLKFHKPFTIFLSWEAGAPKGQQVFYSEGHYDNQMIVRPSGNFFFKWIPLFRINPQDPRILDKNTHSITEAGLGYFLADFALSFERAVKANKIQALSLSEQKLDHRNVHVLNIVFTDPAYTYPRVVVYFSASHHLPVEIHLGDRSHGVSEKYSYRDLKINSPRDNLAFKKIADSRIFKFFQMSAN